MIPRVSTDGWKLTIDGDVERPYSLTFDELLRMPLVERDITLTCVSNEVGGPYVGGARWLGVRTKDLLERAGIKPGVDQIFSHSTDGMTISTPVQALTDDREALVAIAMNGAPLPTDARLPGATGHPRPLRLRRGHQVADPDAGHHATRPRAPTGPTAAGPPTPPSSPSHASTPRAG